MAKINKGDIWYGTWGYEQTNVTFYLVTRVSQYYISLRELDSIYVDNNGMHGSKIPSLTLAKNEKPIRRKIGFDNNFLPCVDITKYHWAAPWDGNAVAVTSYA